MIERPTWRSRCQTRDGPLGRALLLRAGPRATSRGAARVPDEVVDGLRSLGLSSICNVLGAIKTAKYYGMGPDDVIVTVATDGAAMYGSERELALAQDFPDGFDAVSARRGVRRAPARRRHRPPARADRARPRADLQPRLLHLGRAAGRLDRGRSRRAASQAFWQGIRGVVSDWDALIDEFNARAGVLERRDDVASRLVCAGCGAEPAATSRTRSAARTPGRGDGADHVLRRELDYRAVAFPDGRARSRTRSCATGRCSTPTTSPSRTGSRTPSTASSCARSTSGSPPSTATGSR